MRSLVALLSIGCAFSSFAFSLDASTTDPARDRPSPLASLSKSSYEQRRAQRSVLGKPLAQPSHVLNGRDDAELTQSSFEQPSSNSFWPEGRPSATSSTLINSIDTINTIVPFAPCSTPPAPSNAAERQSNVDVDARMPTGLTDSDRIHCLESPHCLLCPPVPPPPPPMNDNSSIDNADGAQVAAETDGTTAFPSPSSATILTCYKHDCQCHVGNLSNHYMPASPWTCHGLNLCLSCPANTIPFIWGPMAVCLDVWKHRAVGAEGNPLTGWDVDGEIHGGLLSRVEMSGAESRRLSLSKSKSKSKSKPKSKTKGSSPAGRRNDADWTTAETKGSWSNRIVATSAFLVIPATLISTILSIIMIHEIFR